MSYLYLLVALLSILSFSFAQLPPTIDLVATCRDFTPDTNPDFESFGGGVETGMVTQTLVNGKPGYVPGAQQFTSAASFAQWYEDVPGVNIPFFVPLTLDEIGTSDVYSISNQAFFPLDNRGFGNYANTGHNFHFTCEIHTKFTYQGGEIFTYIGDDDVWVYINGILAIDLGGVHSAASSSVDLDASASQLGLTVGGDYTLDIFQAERHTTGSTLRIDTSILLKANPIQPPTVDQYCAQTDPNDYSYGQGYYCYNNNGVDGFAQCYSSGASFQPCASGTHCGCAVGVECSNGGTQNPCVI